MLPEGIISTDFPPFYLFFIGIIFLIIGLFFFFWNKIRKLGKKKISMIITLIVVTFFILSLPIISRSLVSHTDRLIRNDEIVWKANQSIKTEKELKSIFESVVDKSISSLTIV